MRSSSELNAVGGFKASCCEAVGPRMCVSMVTLVAVRTSALYQGDWQPQEEDPSFFPPAQVQYVVCSQSGQLYATGLLHGPLQVQAEPAPGFTVWVSWHFEQQGKPCTVGTTKYTLLTSAKCCFPQEKPTYGFR